MPALRHANLDEIDREPDETEPELEAPAPARDATDLASAAHVWARAEHHTQASACSGGARGEPVGARVNPSGLTRDPAR